MAWYSGNWGYFTLHKNRWRGPPCSSHFLCSKSSQPQVKLKKSVIGPAYASGCIWGVGFACMMKGNLDFEEKRAWRKWHLFRGHVSFRGCNLKPEGISILLQGTITYPLPRGTFESMIFFGYMQDGRWWQQDEKLKDNCWWWEASTGWHRWKKPTENCQWQHRWLVSEEGCAILVMYRRNEKQFLEFALDRLLAHPAMQAPMRKVQGDLDAHGVQGYEKYFPEGWIS